MQHKILLVLALCGAVALAGAVAPLAVADGGGGNGGENGELASQAPAFMPFEPAKFLLANGQRVAIKGTLDGTKLTGKLIVLARSRFYMMMPQTFPFPIALGDFDFSGDVTPTGFELRGDFGAQGLFVLTGQPETQTENGSYSFTVGGVTTSGIFPAPNPTPPKKRVSFDRHHADYF